MRLRGAGSPAAPLRSLPAARPSRIRKALSDGDSRAGAGRIRSPRPRPQTTSSSRRRRCHDRADVRSWVPPNHQSRERRHIAGALGDGGSLGIGLSCKSSQTLRSGAVRRRDGGGQEAEEPLQVSVFPRLVEHHRLFIGDGWGDLVEPQRAGTGWHRRSRSVRGNKGPSSRCAAPIQGS